VAGPACRSCLSFLIACRKRNQGYKVMTVGKVSGDENSLLNVLYFRNDEIGSSHMIYRLFFFSFPYFFFFYNVLDGDNSSISDTAAV